MPDITLQNLNKSFGEHEVLRDLSFEIFEGEKVGLLGANGAGKTTLFKILTGEYDFDSGVVLHAPGKRIAVLDQIPEYPPEFTAEDVMKTAFFELDRLKEKLTDLEAQMADHPDERTVKAYGEVLSQYEAFGGYDTDFELDRVANGLFITDALRRRPFSLLSGGEKTRVNLARVMLQKADILLLDEPTNHLDLTAAGFLGDYLSSYKNTVVMISHDRYFLDQVVDRIIELDGGHASFYDGNYSYYAVERERRREEALLLYEQNAAERKRLEDAAAKLHAWGTQSVKMHKRAFAIEKRIEKMQVFERPPTKRALTLTFGENEYHTETLFRVRDLCKSYADHPVLRNVEFSVKNGDRIAIIGENGSGKTTLLRLLLNEEKPDCGFVRRDAGVKIAYLPQNVVFPNPERNLIDTMIYAKNLSTQTARNRLGAFGFSGEEQKKLVHTLSGGEKSRLKLCTLMYDQINTLILDEPTNHLDIDSREWIEDAVSAFSGTLLFVSHDRYFISRFANRILSVANGSVTDFKGTYEEYLRAQEALSGQPAEQNPKKEKVEPRHAKTRDKKALQKEVASLERQIDKTEQELAQYEALFAENASDHVRLSELLSEKTQIETTLGEMMDRWQSLSLLLEND